MEFTFLEGYLGGAASVGAVKVVLTQIQKRLEDRIAGQRKLAQEELKALGDLISPIFSLAIKYYASPTDEVIKEEKQLAVDVRNFAMKWNAVNATLKSYGKGSLPDHLLISFRKSATSEHGVRRDKGLPLDTGLVFALQRSSENITVAISAARYELA